MIKTARYSVIQLFKRIIFLSPLVPRRRKHDKLEKRGDDLADEANALASAVDLEPIPRRR